MAKLIFEKKCMHRENKQLKLKMLCTDTVQNKDFVIFFILKLKGATQINFYNSIHICCFDFYVT